MIRPLVLLGIFLSAEAFTNIGVHVKTPTALHSHVGDIDRRSSIKSIFAASIAFLQSPMPAIARLEPVNKPELLPTESGLNVIQTEKFLTPGQVRRMDGMLANLEKDTGFRVRVLCQSYPNTPGLAIRDYWDLGKEVSSLEFRGEWFSDIV